MQKPDIIILAAGLSTRMGKSKTEIVLKGKTILETAIETIYDICESIIVVTGHFHQSQQKILSPYKKVKIVYNDNYNDGMFSSIKTGIRFVSQRFFFLLPGDIPFVKFTTYKLMLKKQNEIIIPIYNGRKGHPVLMNSNLIAQILSEPDESNLRNFIRQKEIITFDVDDENILKDLDYPEDI